jgi:alkanesulfonate monooxygenase SsuD/methylene tetrahydromethanopterin reductase-like flavin-dependent oxidoreductase (luciferase family)
MTGIKVGVVLPRPPDDPGEWLTEAVAFEAAGAGALWLDHGRAPLLDPLVLTAALAAVTYRAQLVAAVPQAVPAMLATVERLSRGRLALIGTGTVHRLPDGSYEEDGAGRWTPAAVPLGRAAWRETLRRARERGDHGVLVPAAPALIDMLRNPEDPGGRHDLHIAQG